MISQMIGGVEFITHLGWSWNPSEQHWEHWTLAGSRMIVPRYTLDRPPWFSPWQLGAP